MFNIYNCKQEVSYGKYDTPDAALFAAIRAARAAGHTKFMVTMNELDGAVELPNGTPLYTTQLSTNKPGRPLGYSPTGKKASALKFMGRPSSTGWFKVKQDSEDQGMIAFAPTNMGEGEAALVFVNDENADVGNVWIGNALEQMRKTLKGTRKAISIDTFVMDMADSAAITVPEGAKGAYLGYKGDRKEPLRIIGKKLIMATERKPVAKAGSKY